MVVKPAAWPCLSADCLQHQRAICTWCVRVMHKGEAAAATVAVVRSLVDQGLYQSAEITGSFLLSRVDAFRDPIGKLDATIAYADAVFALRQYRRAANYYRSAIAQARTSSSQQRRSSGGTPSSASVVNEAQLKYQIYRCHVELNEPRAALAMLESISARQRTLQINLKLAQTYDSAGVDRAAVTCYKEVLRQCPDAVEAIEALLRLKVPLHEVLRLCSKEDWVRSWAEAHAAAVQHDTRRAHDLFTSLDASHPSNVHVLLNIARCHEHSSRLEQAISVLKRVRVVDDCCLDRMDTYAHLLHSVGNASELNQLVHDLLRVSTLRPEPWVAAGLYSDVIGERERAVYLVDTALSSDPNHVQAYLSKGRILLASKQGSKAIVCFRKAFTLEQSLPVFQGLVQSYMSVGGKFKEAVWAARQAYDAMPNSAHARALMGIVLSRSPDAVDKSRRVLQQAIALDANCLDAILALADLDVEQKRYKEACELLEQHLKLNRGSTLHTKLASVLTLNMQYTDALVHYHHALTQNPANDVARRGLMHLERLMKGFDPEDEDEDEDEDDDGDGDGDVDDEDAQGVVQDLEEEELDEEGDNSFFTFQA